jgi:hypothetical protein
LIEKLVPNLSVGEKVCYKLSQMCEKLHLGTVSDLLYKSINEENRTKLEVLKDATKIVEKVTGILKSAAESTTQSPSPTPQQQTNRTKQLGD